MQSQGAEARSNAATDLPKRVRVKSIVSSRYKDNQRPESWDARRAGNDIVETEELGRVKLYSDGGQSPPHPGWVILLSTGEADSGYHWTLYGIPAN